MQKIIDWFGIGRKTLYQWRKEGSKPDPVRGLEVAKGKGWVPLKFSSEALPALNKICAWILSGGSISSLYVVSLSGRLEDLKKLEKDVRRLGLKPTFLEARWGKGGERT
ncbi:hypothetical protein AKJ66_00045 [candidate division MSBL1 archaeon SCGC-AAA259E22]|uniref:Uncharacterized protein n=1 Tax=candidate division MSBL1 archaeon SCGC-AAA259E22 TaxID=1698265 RepID=A0A133UIC5_9EURY|nr:hypothetical protein AKJ66_00045 [candidate division MSBL1 archaeon SCGC-AAA259E22]